MTLSRPALGFTIPIFIACFFSCHKKDIVGPAGPQGPQGPPGTSVVAKGDIDGKVLLYDIFGQPLPIGSGAIISLDNTSPQVQATSAADGGFTLPSVHEGVYDLTVAKDGYGNMHYFNIAHSGTTSATETGILSLSQQMPSQYDVKQLKIDSANQHAIGNYLVFTVILAHPQKVTNPVLLYFNDSTGAGNSKNRYVFESTFFQQDDTTLIYSPFDNALSIFSDKLGKVDYVYVSAAIDNANKVSYVDKNGNEVHPAAGKQSPESILSNVLHKF